MGCARRPASLALDVSRRRRRGVPRRRDRGPVRQVAHERIADAPLHRWWRVSHQRLRSRSTTIPSERPARKTQPTKATEISVASVVIAGDPQRAHVYAQQSPTEDHRRRPRRLARRPRPPHPSPAPPARTPHTSACFPRGLRSRRRGGRRGSARMRSMPRPPGTSRIAAAGMQCHRFDTSGSMEAPQPSPTGGARGMGHRSTDTARNSPAHPAAA